MFGEARAATVAGYGGPVSPLGRQATSIEHSIGKRDRTIDPEGVSHTSLGHRPRNRIRENKCVLKEHRIGSVGAEVRGTQPMRRSFRTRGCFSGWIPRVGTLGWYAMPLQGMDRERGRRSGVGDAIGAPYRKRDGPPYRKRRGRCVRMGLFAEVAGHQRLVTGLVAPSP